MYIIAGLGNPGGTYKGTRHNVGFETIDKLSYDFSIPVGKRRCRALMGEGSMEKHPVLLVKPQTFMNLSGESLREILRYHKIPPSEMIVIYDDVNLPVGDIRVRIKGSAGGHNGMKSIIEQLATDEFPRVRIGVGQKPDGWDLADYVLSRFRKEEWEAMIEGVTKAGDAVSLILREGAEAAMNRYNKINKKNPPSKREQPGDREDA